MFIYRSKYSILYKAIAIAMVCLFLVNDIAWAAPPDRISYEQTTLAAESRLKPFSEAHRLDFRNTVTAAYIAKEIKTLVKAKKLRESHIVKFNNRFPNGEVKIDKNVKTGIFQCSKREYKYAVFHFKNENVTVTIHALFVDNLDKGERRELGIRDDEKHHLAYPGLEGVWFVNHDASTAAPQVLPPKLLTLDDFYRLQMKLSSQPDNKEELLELVKERLRAAGELIKSLEAPPDVLKKMEEFRERNGFDGVLPELAHLPQLKNELVIVSMTYVD
ncbi:MAG: hypothetical protein Q8R14_03300 [Candidatus Omnitrophota bacterium]|nr:hypothetical protein [Candidatus Omnitrophota bacterium]